jgi:hypothetical protein
MDLQKHINRMRTRIEAELLPDICTITTVSGSPTVNEVGVLIPGGTTNRLYNGSSSIPCRLATSRSFRPEKLPNQEVNANEYVLHLPLSVPLMANDRITVVKDGVTHKFEVRKLTELSEWRVTKEALVIELDFQHD